jgi:para-nitrobenzyl esterase
MKTNRREFVQGIGAGSLGLGLASTLALSSCTAPESTAPESKVAGGADGQILFIGDNIAVADTQYGKVKGYVLRGIHYFLGMPYGADTSGANRFMPPQKPKPWTDVFPAVWWGNTAPQDMENRYANKYNTLVDHWNYDDVSEDCLRINVFTPGINDGKKRPVMLWLHGGGFTSGNGIEQDGYNGENFARFGDVVFCSLNHRLGPMGFSNFAAVAGEKFAASGNVGMLDLVAALEWIRDNIANFGGDPGNVTIMGQSGGGSKVVTLTAMPSAKGLFHKAVALSGGGIRTGEKEYSEKIAAYILKEARMTAAGIEKLQKMPWREYPALADRAVAKVNEELGPSATGARRGFGPCVDGVFIPQHPYYPEPSPTAAEVPMIISTTFHERTPSRVDAALENVTLEEVKDKVKNAVRTGPGLGDKAGAVVDAYAKAFPNFKPVEIWSLIIANRSNAIALCDAKAKQPAPVYNAWFGWAPPLFDNRLRAFHCSDICFWYYNTDLMLTHTGGGARPRKLSEKMAKSLLQFMRTGDPNGGGLPQWPRYTTEKGEVMILDDVAEVKNDPDREARKSLL